MKNETTAPAHAGDHPEDVELFCLELDHQVQTSIKPAMRALLDRKQKVFDAMISCLAKPAPRHVAKPGRERKDKGSGKCTGTRTKVGNQGKRTKRRRSKAKPAFVRDLAVRLARRWQAPLVIDPRLKTAG